MELVEKSLVWEISNIYFIWYIAVTEVTPDSCHDYHVQGQHISLLISGTSSQSATLVATSATSEGSLVKKVWLCVCVCVWVCVCVCVCECAQAYE